MQQQGNGMRAKQDALQAGYRFLSAVGLRNPARWARRPRKWNRWSALSSFPKLQMVEDLADDFRLFDEGHDFHRRQATRTSEGVDFIDPAQ